MNCKIISTQSNTKYDNFNHKIAISYFTPTYNRCQFLYRVYKCLLTQTSSSFVWIIVNDGSSDKTDEVARTIVNEDKIPVLYINKENGGKHSAFKTALDNCKTEYFQCMDDDDIYSEISTEFFIKKMEEISDRKDIGAIRVLSQYSDGEIVLKGKSRWDTSKNTPDIEDCTTLEMNYINKCFMENWTCYKTSALKLTNLFDQNYWLAEEHQFFTEAIWQGRFARLFKCRYIYTPLRIYTSDSSESITRGPKTYSRYLNMFINSKLLLDEQCDYISKSFIGFTKTTLIVELLRNYLDISQRELIKHTNSRKIRIMYTLMYPISFFGKKILKNRSKS